MTFLLAHLSDAHLRLNIRPPLHEMLNKRLLGWANWHRLRKHLHQTEALEILVKDMLGQRPDHIAMTGDISNLGHGCEFGPAAKWLASLGDPEDVSFVPGNHDVYVRSSLTALNHTFAPWTTGERASTQSLFPYLRVRDSVALIGLSSAVPTGPLMASGRLGRAQRQWLSHQLEVLKAQGLCRVIMIHHPPYRLGAGFARGLRDAKYLERVLAKQGAELVLHGHNHRMQVTHLAGPEGTRIPVVGVASASAVPGSPSHLAAYHLYEIKRTSEGGWTIDLHVRGLDQRHGGVTQIKHVRM